MPERAPAGPPVGPGARRLASPGLRRLASQAWLVAALLAVFTVCAATAGASGLLLTSGSDRALSAAVAWADGTENSGGADVTTVLVTGSTTDGELRSDAASLVPVVRKALREAAGPYRATISLWTTTPRLFLDGRDPRCGYLLDADTVSGHGQLSAGAWPTKPAVGGTIPVAIPETTAQALGAGVGTTLRLSRDRSGEDGLSYRLLVSGVFAPDSSPAWARDTLRGSGYHPDYLRLPTFGPFVVAPGTLAALAAPVERVSAVLDPELGGDADGVPALLGRVGGLATHLQDVLGPAINPVVVWSSLGAEFALLRAELAVTNALVVAVLLLVLVLGAAAAALVAGVLVGRRGAETTLLRDRGASTAQLVRGATVGAALVAAAAVVLGAPLALVAYGITAPASSAAAVAGGAPSVPVLLLGLLVGVALPAVVVVAAMLPERPRRGRQLLSGPLARSGMDLLLIGLAVVAYLQLRTHVPTDGRIDPFLAVTPALCVLAVSAVAVRLLPAIARAGDAAAGRSRTLVLPLAGWHVARGGAGRGVFLVVLATAVTTFGVVFLATWSTSQADQAAAEVGADLVVARPGGPGTARELASATGGTVTPVADRAVVLGSRPGGVKLLALDAAVADRMLTSRPPDDSGWPAVMAGLAPDDDSAALDIGSGPGAVTVTGGLRPGSGAGLPVPIVGVSTTLVLADESGSTTTLAGPEVPLDGRPHTIRFPTPGQAGLAPGQWRLVAIDLHLVDHTIEDLFPWGTNSAAVQLRVTVAGASGAGGAWDAASSSDGTVRPGELSAHGDTVEATFSYSVLNLSWQDAHLTLVSFPASTQVPVAPTAALAGELGLAAGDRIGLAWESKALEAVVVRTVPYVPGQVRDAALLADRTSLQRALLSAGLLEPPTDAWWVSGPRPGAAEALRASGAGRVLDRTETTAALQDGPLRAPLPVAWWLAIAAAVGLALTGSAAHAAAEAQRRGTTLARVRALGTSRGEALASHLTQHAAVMFLAVALGAACGAVLAALLGPLLVVSPLGERAVPAPTLVWLPLPLAVVLGAVLVGGLLVGIPAAVSVVRRSTASALRAGEAA